MNKVNIIPAKHQHITIVTLTLAVVILQTKYVSKHMDIALK